MTFAPQKAPVLKGAVAPAGAASLLAADAVDIAVANLTSIMEYVRAKNVADPTKAFKSRAGNTETPGNALAALVANDPLFNNLTSIDISAMTAASNVLVSNVACPASFTFLASLRPTSALHNPTTFFGDQNISGSVGGFYMTLSTTGAATVSVATSGDTPWTDTNVLTGNGVTSLIWVSHDATSKISRLGKASSVLSQHTHPVAHGGGTSNLARPFSYYSSVTNDNLLGRIEGFLLLNKAYANDGSVEDNNIAALITAWRAAVGAAN